MPTSANAECTDILGCAAMETCSTASDQQCSRCEARYDLSDGVKDECVKPTGQFAYLLAARLSLARGGHVIILEIPNRTRTEATMSLHDTQQNLVVAISTACQTSHMIGPQLIVFSYLIAFMSRNVSPNKDVNCKFVRNATPIPISNAIPCTRCHCIHVFRCRTLPPDRRPDECTQ